MTSQRISRARRRHSGFIEKTLHELSGALERSLASEQQSQHRGLLQQLDPRVKLLGLLLLTIAAVTARSLLVILAIYGLGVALALASRISLATLTRRAWLGALLFTGVLALPALFLTPGHELARLPLLGWAITQQGLAAAAFLITRVIASVTLTLTLTMTTPWSHLLKALRVLGVPVLFVVILSMTYRYIFLLLESAADMFEARRSRLVGRLSGAERRRLASASLGVLLGKSFQLSQDVYLAMQSRGFRGEIYTLDDFQLRPRDWGALAGFVILAALAFWLGR